MATLLEKRNFYFRDFPTVTYKFGTEEKEVLNFLHRWKISDSVKNNISSYSQWILRDSDTLMNVAKRLYGSEHFYWIVMMMNDMVDPFYDWPFNETVLMRYITRVYGSENIYTFHHWESADDENIYALPAGEVVSSDYAYNKEMISNYDFEFIKNEEKRVIRLLKPELLGQVKTEKEKILSKYYRSA